MEIDSQFAQTRIAVVAHVFYLDIWPEIKSCIDNFVAVCGSGNVDLFLSFPKEFVPNNQLECNSCRTRKFALPNRGHDVGPFIYILSTLSLDDYDYIVKLHTKRDVDSWFNFRKWKGPEWRRELLSFCSTKKATLRSIRALAKYPLLGMVAASGVVDPCGAGIDFDNWDRVDGILARCGIERKGKVMVYGTMFMVRAELMKPIQGRFSFDEFDDISSANPHYAGLAGEMEFAFGCLVSSQGYRVGRGKLGTALKSVVFIALRKISTALHNRRVVI